MFVTKVADSDVPILDEKINKLKEKYFFQSGMIQRLEIYGPEPYKCALGSNLAPKGINWIEI